MTTTAETIVANVRRLSSLFNNNLFTDSQIVTLFNDGAAELYDWMVGQYETWFLTSVDFTLAGGIGQNVFAMPMDKLLKDNTLERSPTNNTPIPIPRLGSWGDRNRIGLVSGGFGLDGGRRYYPAGSNLMVFPPNLAGGDYRLWYTPKYIPVALNAVPAAVAGVPAVVAGVSAAGVYGFTGSNWTSADIGGSITVVGATHPENNGTFTIVSVGSVNAITTSNAASISEAAGSITVTYQPLGTTDAFNTVMEPWVLYPEIHAAISIRTSRQQDTSDLQPKLLQLKQRIATATANRTEEVSQSPLRDGMRWANWYGGSG